MKDIEEIWKEKIIQLIEETKERNPYPEDIFVSLKGKAARNAWNVCCDTIHEKIVEL